jgi:hypothetical protein
MEPFPQAHTANTHKTNLREAKKKSKLKPTNNVAASAMVQFLLSPAAMEVTHRRKAMQLGGDW